VTLTTAKCAALLPHLRGWLPTALAVVAVFALPMINAALGPPASPPRTIAKLPIPYKKAVPQNPKITLPSMQNLAVPRRQINTPERDRSPIRMSLAQWQLELKARISELEAVITRDRQQLRKITNQSQRDNKLMALRQNLSQLAQLREEAALLNGPATALRSAVP
jgi:hypothetical protein